MPKFITSITNIDNAILNDDVYEFCLIGRSNVGKSSFINLLAKAKIAKISRVPGHTKTINFYDFNKFRLIDLPGYGYAKADKSKKLLFLHMINSVLNNRRNIFGVIHVCDIRSITEQDILFSNEIRRKFANYILLLNKSDKIKKNEYKKYINLALQKLKYNNCNSNVYITSIVNRINTNDVTKKILSLI